MDSPFPKVTKGLRPSADQKTSVWVGVPHKQWSILLPVVKRSRKIVPVFDEDGSVSIAIEDADAELGNLVNAFVLGTPKPEGNFIELSAERFGAFMRLMRKLILTNYDMAADDVVDLLSMTESDLSAFYSTIYLHCVGT